MSKFTEQTDWHKPQGAGYVTTATLEWEVGRKGSGLWGRVPVGFPFDKSVPRALRPLRRLKRFWRYFRIFDPHEPSHLKAAALHDWALADGWDRVAAAALFNDALKASGVGVIERLAMTIGVIVWKWK